MERFNGSKIFACQDSLEFLLESRILGVRAQHVNGLPWIPARERTDCLPGSCFFQ